MARRGSRPSLYEVARTRLDRAGQGSDPPAEEAGEAPPPTPRFTPGSSLRLPMGFVVLGIVLVLGFIVLAWWLGKGAGEAGARVDARIQVPVRVARDPLEYQPPASAIEFPALPTEPAVLPPEQSPRAGEPPLDGDKGDPRVRGFHYFVLAETRPAGAEEIAAFCRDQGLDVAVVSGHNARLAQVIALPGLASPRSSDPAYRALDARIEEVGRRWKQSGRRTSFSDRYLQSKGD
ncbi:MAG: hypothetical protein QGI75_04815 [Phycisphaerales bacterium]|nr:hypothetical protein [Phycisphaerales bacterium]MDP6891413.1 hypothetical protein [Phycisphaerales bacterium]